MSTPAKIFQEAISALNQRAMVEAERLFREVLRTEPNHVAALNLLTVLLMSAERFAEAEPFIAKAVSLSNGSDESYYNYGLILKRLNRPKQALEQFNKALSLNPAVPETWNNRGTILNDLGQYKDAILDFDQAILLNPNYSEALANKGKSLTRLKRYDEAVKIYDKALALKPDLAEAWQGFGAVLLELKHFEVFAAYDRALALNVIKALPQSPFNKAPRVGYLRGIDFYKGPELVSAVAFAMNTYHKFHGTYPNLLRPVGFSEKLFKSIFFAERKVPESGNKLFTCNFIPADLKNSISVAKIIWHSPIAKLPRNNEIEPGRYYLKANHGSGMFKKIRYPLTEDEFFYLERTCREWLRQEFGVTTGEWWYNTFEKEILIEEHVGSEDNSISWYCYVFDGVIGHITAHKKTDSGGEFTWFNENFEISTYQLPQFPRIKTICLTQDTKNRLKHCASVIGGQFSFVRIDLLVGDNQKIYLGEMTFAPAAALNSFPNELQAHLGNLWSQEY